MAGGSTSLVSAELERFLTDSTADALALIGDWGSGKTYAWNEALKKIRKSRTAARPGYAYVSLFGLNSLQPNIAPNEQFVMKRGDYAWMMEAQKREPTSDEKAWVAVLDRYGFGSVDEFDKVLSQGVNDGFFDPDAVKVTAEQKNALFVSEKAGNSVAKAWEKFHDSFGGTEESVALAIFESVKSHAKFVTPMNLDGSVRMLKELGYPQKAANLIAHYVEVHSDTLQKLDLDDYPFASELRDLDVRTAFNAKVSSVVDERDPLKVFVHMSKHGTSHADRRLLETLSVAELIDIFKRAGSDTHRVVKAALQMGPRKPGEPSPLPLRAKAAMISIGRESVLNRLRVKRFGITDADLDTDPNANPAS